MMKSKAQGEEGPSN